MGLRAIDAVQRRSRFREDSPDNFAPYRIMTAVAWYADDDGIAGVAGNHRECPSVTTIAERANVHKNTVLNWLPKLQELGELKVEKYGAGRGTHLVYTILLEISPIRLAPGGDNGTSILSSDVSIDSDLGGALAQEMGAIKRLLAQQNKLLVQALAQANGTNGTSDRTGLVLDPYDPYFDPILIQEEEGETPLPPTPPPFPFRPSPKADLPEHEGPADKRAKAIIQVCGLSADIPTHANKAANAAAQLREFSAGWILDRYGPGPPPDDGWHWYSNDWRGQRGDMPTPEQVVETIAKRKTAVQPKPQLNGRSNSRTEEVAAEYALKRQEFFSDG